MRSYPALLLLASFVLTGCKADRPVWQPPGVLVPEAPEQTALHDALPLPLGDYRLQPLADFRLEARVLSRAVYRFDRESQLAPVDLLLGWQRMSDSAVVDRFRFSQSGRWGYWRYSGEPPLPIAEINRSAANMHLIAAEPWIEHQLRRVRVGQVVRIEGQLVEVEHPDGWRWRSSLSREDTGAGSCELVLVRHFSVME